MKLQLFLNACHQELWRLAPPAKKCHNLPEVFQVFQHLGKGALRMDNDVLLSLTVHDKHAVINVPFRVITETD